MSCSTAQVLTFDQLRPAELSFPGEIRQVGVVNNMSKRPKIATRELALGTIKGDGVSASEALAGALADSKFFDQVIICDSVLRADSSDDINPLLSVEEVQTLSSDLGVDMLISLEGLWIETAKKNVTYPGWNAPFPMVQATVTPVVRLYLPNRAQPLHTMALTDSLYWDLSAPLSERLVVDEATKLAVSKVADYLVPSWKQVDRICFYGGCVEMRDAQVYVREGEWQEAQDTWKDLFKRLRKGKTKARAAYNIALSYEMLGDVDNALQWIKESQKFVSKNSAEEQIVKQYTDVLTRRIKEMVSLKAQMNRFNDNF